MPWIVIIIVGAWFIFGNPSKDIANWLWDDGPAPWEKVDAFYYPDRNNLFVDRSARGFVGLEECRDWVYSKAARNGDPTLERGDYECGVGRLGSFGDIGVYRLTLE